MRPTKRPARSSSSEGAAHAQDGIRDLVSQLKRERILSAAIDLFYRQGYARTTIDQVAKSLGMTKPFVYQYFSSKNDLLTEICSRAIRDGHDTLNRLLLQQGTASDKLRIVIRDFTMSVLNNQVNALIYSREEAELSPGDQAMIKQLRRDFDRRVVGLLEEGVKHGEFVIDDLRVASFAIASMVGWSPVWYREGGRLSKADAAENIAALALKMVGATSASAATAARNLANISAT